MMTYGLLRGGKKFGVLVGVLIILTFSLSFFIYIISGLKIICTFAMSCYDFRLLSISNTWLSERSDMAKSWAAFLLLRVLESNNLISVAVLRKGFTDNEHTIGTT